MDDMRDTTAQAEQEFVTIIAPSLTEVMNAYHARGLAEQNYTIVHRAGRHQFTLVSSVDQSTQLFDGEPMTAATFVRRVSR
ncbi:MAG: hypothetical protein P4M09_05065 [Devosia sp.]|nr:hypothetical protein [Devosia sp.]